MSPVTRKISSIGNSAQSGFSLIEALVAAFILAIGILGVVNLLTMSKVSQHEDIQRVRAVALADNMFERLRRNPAGLSDYAASGLGDPLGGGSIEDAPAQDCRASACTAAQLAEYDLWIWEQLLDGASTTVTRDGETANTVAMRNIQACIVFTADAGRTNTGIVDVILQWQGLKETSDALDAGGAVCGDADDEDTTRHQVVVSSYVIDETELN